MFLLNGPHNCGGWQWYYMCYGFAFFLHFSCQKEIEVCLFRKTYEGMERIRYE